jgi:hypothetical protein
MALKPIPRLSDEMYDKAFDLILDGGKLDEIGYAIGLKDGKTLQKYMAEHEDFQDLWNRAKKAAIPRLEEQLLYCPDRYKDDNNKNLAGIKMNVLIKLLEAYAPERWKPKEINVKVDLGLRDVIADADKRLVAPSNVIKLPGKE